MHYEPPQHPCYRLGLGLNEPLTPASESTRERPGSDAKVATLAARAERGEELFHDDDLNCLVRPTERRSDRYSFGWHDDD